MNVVAFKIWFVTHFLKDKIGKYIKGRCMRKFKKPLIILFITITTIVVLAILFISPITKYLVEKYDAKYTGREIKMDWAYVNPFTGYIHFSNVKIYELNSDSIFFSANGVS